MSFKQNHTINLGNYEEYFILYMDNELHGEEKLMVENFVLQHPHLAEELDILMSLKLPFNEVSFSGKEELFSGNMKANLVDESLLLYIDNELPAADRKAVEQKIIADKDYAAQHSILMQTKLDASKKIPHPNKKELYRHTERVVSFKIWMRVAAAVILLLLGSLFFLVNRNEKLPVDDGVVIKAPIKNIPNGKQEKAATPVEQLLEEQIPIQQDAPIVKAPAKKVKPVIKNVIPDDDKKDKQNDINNTDIADNNASRQREVIKFDAKNFTDVSSPESFKKPLTASAVTFNFNKTYNTPEGPDEPAVTDGDFKDKKKTPAKGFFRKVSRFIERNTGIGTVNADNELLIGAVALKLK